MRPLTALGLIFSAFGAAVILWAIGSALMELTGLYQGTVTNPLGQPDGTEQATADRMLQSVWIGLGGVPFLIAGAIMLKITFIQRLRRGLTRPGSGSTRV